MNKLTEKDRISLSGAPVWPTFVGVGAEKCATTWLAVCLGQHPQVFMSAPKEIRYFNRCAYKGDDWYLKHFRKAAGHQAVGEFTASYLMDVSPSVIADLLGPVRLIVCLRNPVSRFVSQYRVEVRRGLLPKEDFQRLTLEKLPAAVSRCPNLIQGGMYYSPLRDYLEVFGREQVHIILKEDMDAAPLRVVQECYRFLGVSTDFAPPALFSQIHRSYIHRSEALQRLRILVARAARRYASWSINTRPRAVLSRLYRRLNEDDKDVALDSAVREYLQSYFAADVICLEGLIGRELPGWKDEADC